MTQTPVSELSFEQAMAELDSLVGKLERGDVALEEMISLNERGAALKAHCETRLKEAEEKVEKITAGADGSATGTTPVEGM